MLFFTYGIFLQESTRENLLGNYETPQYDTVKDYTTVGEHIVEAVPARGTTLTGLVFDITSKQLDKLDNIEAGYDRVTITTVLGRRAIMYVKKRGYNAHH